MSVSSDVADHRRRAARAAAAGCARRRAAGRSAARAAAGTTYTSAASDGLSSALRTCARASATVASGGQDHRLGGHHAAGGVLLVGHQPADVLGLLRLHQLQQLLGRLRRQLGDQVGGVVGGHLLEDVGGPLGVERAEDLDLVLLGQLLEDVGEPLVVEGGGDLARGASGGRSWMTLARSAGRISSSAASRWVAPWLSSGWAKPVDLAPLHDVGLALAAEALRALLQRDPADHPVAGPGSCSIATSYTVPLDRRSRGRSTCRSSICPNTSVSVGRCSKRRMFTTPVVMTCPLSMWVTRVIGTKISRRPNTSTTSPSTRGWQAARPEHHDEVADLADLVALRGRRPAARPGGLRRRGAGRCSRGISVSGWKACLSDATALRHRRRVHRPPFAGNQLAVVHGADELTTRAVPGAGAGVRLLGDHVPRPDVSDGATYAVRIFTPEQEIPFAGPPDPRHRLGAPRRAALLDGRRVRPSTAAPGEIGVRLDGDRVELTATPRDLAGPLDRRPRPRRAARPRPRSRRPRRGGLGGRLPGSTSCTCPVTEEAAGPGPARHAARSDVVDGLAAGLRRPAGRRQPVRRARVTRRRLDVHARVFVPG